MFIEKTLKVNERQNRKKNIGPIKTNTNNLKTINLNKIKKQ